MAEALTVGGWTFGDAPAGWEAIPGAGMRRHQAGRFPSNVVIVPDELQEGETLPAYLDRQRAAMEATLREPQFTGPTPTTLAGADEVLELGIRHAVDGEPAIVQRQLYARRGRQLSVINLTTNGADAQAMQATFDGILRGLKKVDG